MKLHPGLREQYKRDLKKEIQVSQASFIEELQKGTIKAKSKLSFNFKDDAKMKCRGCGKYFTPKLGASIQLCRIGCYPKLATKAGIK